MLKAELRKIYLARQKSLVPLERLKKSEEIRKLFFQIFDLTKIRFLHCFLPIGKFNEINTRLILKIVRRRFPQVEILVPRVNFQTGEIENVKLKAEDKLKENQWSIHEPTHNELIETEMIDLVLVPLLCFDRAGFRVGYGKGFYDKFLENCRADCLKIGLSYFPPIERIEDIKEFDARLNYCLTPESVLKFG